jgi:phospholipase C
MLVATLSVFAERGFEEQTMKSEAGKSSKMLQYLSTFVFTCLIASSVLAACSFPGSTNQGQTTDGIHKIKHVVVIMQENRSFDNYCRDVPQEKENSL